MKPGQSLVVLIDTENAPRILETIQATQLLQLDGHREHQKMGSPVVVAALVAPLASSSSTTTTTSIIEGATTRTATNNFAAEVVGMVAVGTTLPWERECAGYPSHMDMNASGRQALSGPLHPPPSSSTTTSSQDALFEEFCLLYVDLVMVALTANKIRWTSFGFFFGSFFVLIFIRQTISGRGCILQIPTVRLVGRCAPSPCSF